MRPRSRKRRNRALLARPRRRSLQRTTPTSPPRQPPPIESTTVTPGPSDPRPVPSGRSRGEPGDVLDFRRPSSPHGRLAIQGPEEPLAGEVDETIEPEPETNTMPSTPPAKSNTTTLVVVGLLAALLVGGIAYASAAK